MKASDLQVTRFKGLNTVDDPLTLGLGWFTQADNILITADGKVGRRDGFTETPTLAGTSITAAYATRDQERAYLIDDGALLTDGGRLAWVGPSAEAPAADEVVEGFNRLLTNMRRIGSYLYGHTSTDATDALAEGLALPGYKSKVERAFVITVEAFDWNCPQHITPRYTEAELTRLFAPPQGI